MSENKSENKSDGASVNAVIQKFENSTNSIHFKNKEVGYSSSTATDELGDCIKALAAVTKKFLTAQETDMKNLEKIHQAIDKTDKNRARNFKHGK